MGSGVRVLLTLPLVALAGCLPDGSVDPGLTPAAPFAPLASPTT